MSDSSQPPIAAAPSLPLLGAGMWPLSGACWLIRALIRVPTTMQLCELHRARGAPTWLRSCWLTLACRQLPAARLRPVLAAVMRRLCLPSMCQSAVGTSCTCGSCLQTLESTLPRKTTPLFATLRAKRDISVLLRRCWRTLESTRLLAAMLHSLRPRGTATLQPLMRCLTMHASMRALATSVR